MSRSSRPLPFTRLDVHRVATSFVGSVDIVTAALPRGRGYVVDQLRRAALSIQANLAEGADELSPSDKARFYRMALRSASECGALLDDCARLVQRADRTAVEEALVLLDRIVEMTTRLVRRFGSG